MRINTNVAALNTYNKLTSNNIMKEKAMEKLSSGLRINRAGDDAAGLAISEKMRAQIRGLDQAQRNSQDAISLIQTAEGAMTETHSILQRMRELATQASSDTNVAVDRDEIQKEINELSSEINRIGNTTEFNTQRLLNGDKANTYKEFTGVFGDAKGSSSVTVTAGATNPNLGQLNITAGSTLAAGDHTIEITRVGEDHADFTGISKGDFKLSGGNMGNTSLTFSGNTIEVTAGNRVVSGATLSLTVFYSGGNQFVNIKASGGASGKINDNIQVGSDGKLNYDNFGISFNLTNIAAGTSGSIKFDPTATTGGTSLSTAQKGYTVSNGGEWGISDITIGTPTNGVSSGAGLPDVAMKWAIILSGASGTNGFRVSGIDAKTGQALVQDAIATNISAATETYNAYGISFTISGGSGSGGDVIQFSTDPKFTYSASLDGGAASAIKSGAGATLSNADVAGYTIGGLQLTAGSPAGITTGTATFTTYDKGSSGTDKSLTFQIGANQAQSLSLDINDMRSDSIGVTSTTAGKQWVEISRKHDALVEQGVMKSGGDTGVGGEAGKWYIEATFTASHTVTDGTNSSKVEYALDMSTAKGAAAAITVINDAIERISAERSKLGANQNRLEHTINNLNASSENLTAAESRIRDVDMAKEMMAMTKSNILSQASQTMLAQANQAPQSVLQLLG